MKSKAPLTMIELIIMLLVFSLAAAFCLQVFSAADKISDKSIQLDSAVTEAQSAAEVLKGCNGDYDRAADLLGGSWDGQVWTILGENYIIQIAPTEENHSLTERAEVHVNEPNGREIFCLPVVWQKEGSGHG